MGGGSLVRATGTGVTTVLAVPAVLAAGAVAGTLGLGAPATLVPALVAAGLAAGCLWPAYAPHPMRTRTRVHRTATGVVSWAGLLGLAGYAGLGVVPGPATLGLASVALVAVLPVAYRGVRRRVGEVRTIVAGDDPRRLGEAVRSVDPPALGYVSPANAVPELPETAAEAREWLRADGGRHRPTERRPLPAPPAGLPLPVEADDPTGAGSATAVECTGDLAETDGRAGTFDLDRIAGLPELSSVLVDRDVDAVALGFARADREAFFGVLRVCRRHGVDAAVHESQASTVLTAGEGAGPLVDVDLDPLSLRARLAKRGFDVAFAAVALVALAPVMAVVAVAVTLDSPGPVLYAQRRTGRLGRTFDVLKFRSMEVDAEHATGATLSDEDAGGVDPRVTRVGRVLRRTHLDELPQLLAILTGEMSVVGPRPERPELDREIARSGIAWERRWFLKPGLTGLAQIHDVNGFDPEEKLAWDLAYRERQSLRTDVRTVLAQLWLVATDTFAMLRGRSG